VLRVVEVEVAGCGVHVFIAPTGEVDGDDGIRPQLATDAQGSRQGVGRLDRGDDALGAREQPEGLHGLVVGRGDVLRTADVGQPRVLGSDARVVQTRRDRVRLGGLAVFVLQNVGTGAVQDARTTALDGCRVLRRVDAVTGRLDAVEGDALVVEERVEHADRVRSAADAGEDRVREATEALEELGAGLFPDDLLEVADHRGERVRARGGAEDVVGRLDGGDPVAVGLVDRVLQGARTGRHGNDLGAEQAHAGDVQRLTLGVDLAHVDDAVQAEEGRGRRGGDAVLAGSGLGDDAGLAEPLGEQRLTEHVVDLVRPGVVEVFALEEDTGAARVLGEARHLGQDRGATGVVVQEGTQLGVERGVGHRRLVYGGQLVDRGDERLGHVPAAEVAEERPLLVAQAGGHDVSWRNARSVATGSPVTRASPTSTTSAPAAR